jgi:hypothetical protein
MTNPGFKRIADLVMARWPGACQWPDEVWKTWRRELNPWSDEIVETAVRRIHGPYTPGLAAVQVEVRRVNHVRAVRRAREQ